MGADYTYAGYVRQMHENRDNAPDRGHYAEVHGFLRAVKKSRALTWVEKARLTDMAKRGSLETARREYRALVDIREDG